MKLIIPKWSEAPAFNTDEATGWDSCLEEIMKRLEAAGIPYEMEKKFGEGSPENMT